MTDRTRAAPRAARGLLDALEIDTRLLGMAAALLVIWVGFHLATGTFLTARNLWNLSVQMAVVGIVATGMVLVIVTRNIDLSVGSVLGFVGMVMAVVQAEILPGWLGFEHWAIWLLALLAGVLTAALIGAFQGAWIAYAGVPAFIVTLGGLLIFRGAAWWITQGRTVAPMDTTFQLLGGGIAGSIGGTWSWLVGGAAAAATVLLALRGRAQRRRYDFPVRPAWAEATVLAIAVAAILGFVQIMNSYNLPERTVATGIVDRLASQWEAGGGTVDGLPERARDLVAALPEEARALLPGLPGTGRELVGVVQRWDGLPRVPRGIPIPVLILLGVAAIMSFIARRTRFGRYVFAIGGNPDAAELAGVDTRRIVLWVFVIIAVLAAVAGAVQTARLNAGANSSGELLELSAIAAAVIGGTSLAGGIGTIAGALLGALVMQSLQSGMLLLNIDTPLQQIVIGLVLIVAVWIDTVYQRRRR